MHLFTDRNVFNHIYKSKLLSHYFYEHVSSSKKTLRICDVFFIKNSMVSYEQVCVRNRTLKEITTNCDSRIQLMRS